MGIAKICEKFNPNVKNCCQLGWIGCPRYLHCFEIPVDMENVVKCCQDFLWYFNTSSITCLVSLMIYFSIQKMYNLYNSTIRSDSGIDENKRNKDVKILSLHYVYLTCQLWSLFERFLTRFLVDFVKTTPP